jgi:chitodextrinase
MPRRSSKLLKMKKLINGRLNSVKNSKFSPLGLLAFIIVFAGAGYVVLVISRAAPAPQANLNAGQNKKGHLLFLSRQLQQAGLDLKANPGKKPTLGPKLQAIAKERKADLLATIKTDPAAARNLVLSNDVASTLAQDGALVEQPATLTGQYGVKQVDNSTGDHIYSQIVTPDGKTYTLDTEQRIPLIKAGSTIKVSGLQLDDQLLVNQDANTPANIYSAGFTANDPVLATDSGTTAPVTVTASTTTGTTFTTTGQINDVIMMANFTGGSGTVDPNQVKAVYSGTPGADVADLLSANSNGKATLAPTFLGPYNISSSVSCGGSSAFNAVEAAATAAGVNLANYEVHTAFTNCNDGAYASAAGTADIRYIYIGDRYDLHANAHELSHTMDGAWIMLLHGGYLACGPQAFVSPVNSTFDSSACLESEYEDPYDVLGGAAINGTHGLLSASHRIDAGWLDSTQAVTVTTPGTTTYTLKPYETTTGLVALKIPRGNTGTYFTVEYRQPLGFDSYITQGECANIKCNANQGALLRLGGVTFRGPGGGADSNIIDTTPGSNPYGSGYWPSQDEADGALLPGKSFTDPDYNITINTVSASSSGLSVQVTLAQLSCNRAQPTVGTVGPALQTAVPGQTKTFTFSVTNNDSAGCSTNQFRFLPASTISYDTLGSGTVNETAVPDFFTLAPGATQTVSLNVTSNANTPDGDYLNTYEGAGYLFTKTYGLTALVVSGGDYRVATAADTTLPSQPTNVVATDIGSAAATLSWTASTDNTGVLGYWVMLNDGSAYFTNSTSLTLPYLLPSTSYSFTVQAYDHKENKSTPGTASLTTPAQTDFIAPSFSSNLAATATDHSFTLSWSKATDNGRIAWYSGGACMYPGDNCVTPANQTSETVSSPSDLYYNQEVYAFDGDGNNSYGTSGSQAIIFSTAMYGDPAAPTQPQQLYAVQTSIKGTVLTWQASTDDKSIAGYYIYKGAGRYAYTTGNTYTDPSPYTNDYRVQAVDSDGSISPISVDFQAQGGANAGSTDTTPPTAAVSSPANGATVSGTITLQSSSTDNVSIYALGYYLDGKFVGYSYSSPWSLSLDTTKYPDGKHWLLANAVDPTGNAGSSGPITVVFSNYGGTADITPPSVSITAPASGASVSGTVNVTASASDNVGVSKVDFLVDGSLAASDSSWDTTKLTNGTHVIITNAYDAAGNNSSASVTVNVSNGDKTPPSTPAGLTASAGAYNKVNLSWTASSDNVGVVGYYIVRGGTTIAQTSGIGTTYSDTTVNASTTYSYQVMAFDAAGNTSSLSATASVTTPSAPDTTPPSSTNLTASAVSTSQINLAWTAATDNIGVTSYDIYRGGTKIASVAASSLSFGDSGLNASTTYSYYIIARDAAGNSSSPSGTASATTQAVVQPPQTNGTISGTVYSSRGGTITGATISLSFGGSKHNYSSSVGGVYIINNVPAGSYTVKYSEQGFSTQSITLQVSSGQTLTQNVTLASRK